MEILFVTSELAPYSKSSPLADAAMALPKSLRGLGHRVTVLSPLYANIDPTARSLARRLSTLSVEAMGKTHVCTLYDGRTTGGVDVTFLANAEVFGARHAGEGDAEQQALAAVVLGAAAAQFALKREAAVEILHAIGPDAAFTLVEAKKLAPQLPRVLSLVDAPSSDALSHALLDALALPADTRAAFPDVLPNIVGAGIAAADLVITNAASGMFAYTPGEEASHAALTSLLGAKATRLIGVVNGVDASIWNPLTDSYLSARFDPVNAQGKARCKGSLQYGIGLNVDPNTPVITAIGPLTAARGVERIAQIAEYVLRNEAQLAVLYEGEVDRALASLAESQPERVALHACVGTDAEKLRHLAIAGSDFLLIPTREARGLDLGLAALRYGTLPIARPIGVLGDALVDTDAKLETGNAFLIDADSEADTLATVQRALGSYAMGPTFDALRRRAMRTDVSWERSARRCEHAYRQLRTANAA